MELLAYFAPIAAATIADTSGTQTLPVFKPKWWFRRDRLDARPVAWSLRNRPEDWEWITVGGQRSNFVVRHKPSKHEFWMNPDVKDYHLWNADCSCTSSSERGNFQRWQTRLIHKAFLYWRDTYDNPGVDHAQFVAHFVR